MTKAIPPHRTLQSSALLQRPGLLPPGAVQAQKVLLGVDRQGQEFVVWTEFQSAQGQGQRPVVFTDDLAEAVAKYNLKIEQMAAQGYLGAADERQLEEEIIAIQL